MKQKQQYESVTVGSTKVAREMHGLPVFYADFELRVVVSKQNVIGDFRFVVLEKFLSYENELPFFERITMEAYFFIKSFTNSEDKWFGLDSSSVKVEKVPLIIRPAENVRLKRIHS